jgi:hypothetical protein
VPPGAALGVGMLSACRCLTARTGRESRSLYGGIGRCSWGLGLGQRCPSGQLVELTDVRERRCEPLAYAGVGAPDDSPGPFIHEGVRTGLGRSGGILRDFPAPSANARGDPMLIGTGHPLAGVIPL